MKFKIKSYTSKFYYCDKVGRYATLEDLAKPDFQPCTTNKFEIVCNNCIEQVDLLYDSFNDELKLIMPNGIFTPVINEHSLLEDLKDIFQSHLPEVKNNDINWWDRCDWADYLRLAI